MANNGKHVNNTNKPDFRHPPEGYAYYAIVLTKEMLEDWDLDESHITNWYINGKRRRCYMELAPKEVYDFLENSRQAEEKKEARRNRCLIRSKVTGRLICCPDDRSCIGCPFNSNDDIWHVRPLSCDKMLEDGIEPEVYDETCELALTRLKLQEALTHMTQQNRQLAEITRLNPAGYSAKEIGTRLHLSKSTVYEQMNTARQCLRTYI